MFLAKYGLPAITNNEVFKEISKQAEILKSIIGKYDE